MSDKELHLDDHRAIMNALDCSQQVAALDKDISLLHLMIKEMKADKDKANRTLMWVCGMAFTIIMAVAGSLISSSADVKVLQEKVMEQKSEIQQLKDYFNTHEH